MSDQLVAEVYWRKAVESLAGAQSECASARYSNCANRAYYAAFQAAISTLLQNGIRTSCWSMAAHVCAVRICRKTHQPPTILSV